MIRNNVAADLIVRIRACLGEGCAYDVFQSRGMPPAECDQIALVWGDARTIRSGDCGGAECDTERSHTLNLVLTKCCIGVDAGNSGKWDSSKEHEESRCFYRDVETIEHCILCNDFRQIVFDHGLESLSLRGVSFSPMTSGGCMSATISLEIIESVCC